MVFRGNLALDNSLDSVVQCAGGVIVGLDNSLGFLASVSGFVNFGVSVTTVSVGFSHVEDHFWNKVLFCVVRTGEVRDRFMDLSLSRKFWIYFDSITVKGIRS